MISTEFTINLIPEKKTSCLLTWIKMIKDSTKWYIRSSTKFKKQIKRKMIRNSFKINNIFPNIFLIIMVKDL